MIKNTRNLYFTVDEDKNKLLKSVLDKDNILYELQYWRFVISVATQARSYCSRLGTHKRCTGELGLFLSGRFERRRRLVEL